MTVLLPDVSEFQRGTTAPNWAGIAAQNGGAGIIRVVYGITHLDSMFVMNYTQMKTANFRFMGLYHYLRQDQDAATQARAFCNLVGPASALVPGSIPILDLEEGGGNQSGRANTWLSIVDAHFGLDKLPLNMRSWLYSGESFAQSQGLTPIFNSARHTWVAAYRASEPSLPHTLWQSTDGAVGANRTRWAGCGFVDTSIFHGSMDQLAAMTVQPGHVTPPPPPPHVKGEDMPQGTITAGQTIPVSFPRGSVKRVVFFAASPANVNLQIAHADSSPFDAGKQTANPRDSYTIVNNGDVDAIVLSGATGTIAWHTE
jgi:hypothetical protein